MRLADLIQDDAAIDDIAAFLDGLDDATRQQQVLALNKPHQKKLFAKAADAAPLTLDFFVPDDVDDGVAVRHEGLNTLPLPKKHKRFAKVFCKSPTPKERLFGYNDAPSGWLIGPGYYVAVPTAGNADWEERGAIVVDYFKVPDAAVVEGWPKVVPNSRGLQLFVYHRTRDFMRRVSEHVSIGAAYKGETALNNYFVLVRSP